MAAMKTLSEWLQGSGWVQALVQAQITSTGTADSCGHHYLELSDERNEELEFDDWCQQ